MSIASLTSSARAKLALGTDPNEVYSFLDREGLAPEAAQQIVHALLDEQASEVRYQGRVHAGAGLAAVALGTFLLDVWGPHVSSGAVGLLAGIVLTGGGGFYLLTGGFKAITGRSRLS